MILAPFFLDAPVPALESLAGPDWRQVRPSLPAASDATGPRGGRGAEGAWDHQPARQTRMAAIHRALADEVAAALEGGSRPVSVAGDCCTAIGVLAGLQRAGLSPGLLWLDAHGDFNDWESTPSGFLGGMPLAMMAGLGEQRLMEAAGAVPLDPTRILLGDGRDLDPGERRLVERSGIGHHPDVTTLRLDHLPPGPLWLHFDTDIIDPADAPAMHYPAPGGPRAAALAPVLGRLAVSGRLAAISMTTWDPARPGATRSRTTCLSLLQQLLDQEGNGAKAPTSAFDPDGPPS